MKFGLLLIQAMCVMINVVMIIAFWPNFDPWNIVAGIFCLMCMVYTAATGPVE